MNPAPQEAIQRISISKSRKSPMPQLSWERSVYSCTATPHSRRPAAIAAGSKHLRRRNDQQATVERAAGDLRLELVVAGRQIHGQLEAAARDP